MYFSRRLVAPVSIWRSPANDWAQAFTLVSEKPPAHCSRPSSFGTTTPSRDGMCWNDPPTLVRPSGATLVIWKTPALPLTDVRPASARPAALKNADDESSARARNAFASRLEVSPAATEL